MFVHLHNHSEFSLLDGAIKIHEMVARAAKLGMPALAITDHANMYGTIDFYKACKKHNVKPIIGVEVYVSPEGIDNKVPKTSFYHLLLLAENNKGYENMMGLVTESNIRGFYYKPRVDYETLAKYSDGVLALTACISGEVPERLLKDDEKGAKEALGKYKEIFKNRVWVELQNHEMSEEIRVIPRLLELAREFELPIVGTQDAHYLEHEDAEAHDILLCIQTLAKQDDLERMRFANSEFYMKTAVQMERIFGYVPSAISNTLDIAERCNVNIELGKPHPPKFTDIKDDNPVAHIKFLVEIVEKGAKWRFGENLSSDVRERLDYELKVIEMTGFVDYFLVVWDFIKYAKEQLISVGPGRGSGAASLVSFCLNITDVNPLEYGLFFERFLNLERISPPDFDIDFDANRRDEVITYVTHKYGEDSVAQVATFGRMEARAVLRDVGRALGFSYQDIDKIAKLVPFGFDLNDALSTVPQLREIEDQGERNKKLFEIARKLEGVVRNFSTHAAGVVMADKPLYHYVPLQLDKEGKRVTQFELNGIGELGILKVDFLGLRNLTVIDSTIKLIKKHTGKFLDLEKIPLDDKSTFDMLKVGDTMGVFQLESAGMRRYLRELEPTKVSDLIAMVALFRPGPMQFIPDFIAGKHGRKVFKYLDPSLEPILAPTYGIVVYQEQVLQIARDFAGFTLGQADILRKAMGKKIPELLVQQKEEFIKKAVSVGRDSKVADEVFKFIEPFAGYGFNKAHATCYGLLAYKTAYLKTHYKLEYYTSILTSYIGNEDRIKEWYEECRRSGIELLPPDINLSSTEFMIEGNKIRYSLTALKNIGEAAIEIIRKENGKGNFKSFENFIQRIDSTKVNKKVVESLIKAGAFDSLGDDRGNLLKQYGGQGLNGSSLSLFDKCKSTGVIKSTPKEELLRMEKEILGFYMSDHPMRPYEKYLQNEDHIDIARLTEIDDDQCVVIMGIVTGHKRSKSKKGSPIATCTIEDLSGICQVIAFGRAYEPISEILDQDNIVVIKGRIESKEGQPRIVAEELVKVIKPSEFLKNGNKESYNVNVLINLETQFNLLEKIKAIISEQGEGNNPLVLHLQKTGRKMTMESEKNFWIKDQNTIQKIKAIVGSNQVWLTPRGSQ